MPFIAQPGSPLFGQEPNVSALLELLVVGFATVAVLMLCAALVYGWRLARDPSRTRLLAALRAQELAPPQSQVGAALRTALSRCAQCARAKRCSRALAAKDRASLRAFCPNIGYFDSLRSG
jgi:hypothetical protein